MPIYAYAEYLRRSHLVRKNRRTLEKEKKHGRRRAMREKSEPPVGHLGGERERERLVPREEAEQAHHAHQARRERRKNRELAQVAAALGEGYRGADGAVAIMEM